jgi:hypothetical protein
MRDELSAIDQHKVFGDLMELPEDRKRFRVTGSTKSSPKAPEVFIDSRLDLSAEAITKSKALVTSWVSASKRRSICTHPKDTFTYRILNDQLRYWFCNLGSHCMAQNSHLTFSTAHLEILLS